MPQVIFHDLGLIDYKECWDYQEKLFNEIVAQKLQNRNLPVTAPENGTADSIMQTRQALSLPSIVQTAYALPLPTSNYLLFCEHPHVYTLGKNGSEENLLLDKSGLKRKEATFFKINRGGDITYHGPGQLVGYPIFDLDNFFTDIHKYLRFLEEAIILTLAEYSITGERYPGYTGVWIEPQNPLRARKICAMGVRCSRWVTMHGFAFNVNPDLNYFENIIPCGITGKAVTSMEKELGRKIELKEVKEKVKNHLAQLFEFKLCKKISSLR